MSVRSATAPSLRPTPSAPAGLLARHAAGRTECHVAPVPLAHGLQSPAGGRTEATVRIDLPHMDVVISLSRETSARGGDSLDLSMPAVAEMVSADPVMQRLVDQLGRSGTSEIVDDGLYADAIRLALAARWLRLRSSEPGKATASLQKWRLNRVIAYIGENLGKSISLSDLARVSGLSRMYFAAGFRAATGLRPHDYVLQQRIAQAKVLLAQSEEPLVNVALDVGFQSQSHFTTVFKRICGTTPGRWRASARQPA